MDGILELREFVPEPKYVETNELDRKNSAKHQQKYVHITKEILYKDQSIISFYGWMYIKRVNSRAGVGTLAFNGEMNNIQHTAVGAARAKNSRLEQASVRGLGQSPRQLNSRQAHRKRHETKSTSSAT
jgi:hypothetical protein